MADSAPDWHPDPTGRHELRYWDGSHWTDHVASGGVQARDHMDAGAATTAAEASVSDVAWRHSADQPPPADQPPVVENKQGLFARRREERRAKDSSRDEFEAIAVR